jgi:hypothetical protein
VFCFRVKKIDPAENCIGIGLNDSIFRFWSSGGFFGAAAAVLVVFAGHKKRRRRRDPAAKKRRKQNARAVWNESLSLKTP